LVFSIGGAADSESTYLVEGQDTENNSGGYSKANVPFSFIQEVEVKTSGIEAEHGGALGGVINVIMKKGSNAFHGEFFGTYEPSAWTRIPRMLTCVMIPLMPATPPSVWTLGHSFTNRRKTITAFCKLESPLAAR